MKGHFYRVTREPGSQRGKTLDETFRRECISRFFSLGKGKLSDWILHCETQLGLSCISIDHHGKETNDFIRLYLTTTTTTTTADDIWMMINLYIENGDGNSCSAVTNRDGIYVYLSHCIVF